MPALLVSVGGSLEPILHSVRTHRPSHVAYFCSSGTRDTAEAIQASLSAGATGETHPPFPDYLEVGRYEELGPCYAALRQAIPAWLATHAIDPADVIVDYTGGTKTMSAALVLAASELFSNFSYIGGTQRDKAGVGVVLSGSESVHYQTNPWRELAVREFDRAATLWSTGQYQAARGLLRATKKQLPLERRPACERVILLADALDDRLALCLHAAASKFADLAKKLGKQTPPPAALLAYCELAATRLASAHAASGPAADPRAQLRELLDNALLTARLDRHDDASARLYRALELFGQNELARLTGGAFHLGQLAKKLTAVPPALATFPPFAAPDGPALARRGIPLEQVYRALAHLGHPAGLRAVAEFDGPEASKSPWRAATQRRNQSILAHGLQPVGPEGFAALASLVADYTGEQTGLPELDAPTWDSAWLS